MHGTQIIAPLKLIDARASLSGRPEKIRMFSGFGLCCADALLVMIALGLTGSMSHQKAAHEPRFIFVGTMMYLLACIIAGCWNPRLSGRPKFSAAFGAIAITFCEVLAWNVLAIADGGAAPLFPADKIVLAASVAALVSALVRISVCRLLGIPVGSQEARIVLCEPYPEQPTVPSGAIDTRAVCDPAAVTLTEYNLLADIMRGADRATIRCAPGRRQLWIDALSGMNVGIELEIPEIAGLDPVGLHSLAGAPVILVRLPPLTLFERALKRAFDLVVSASALACLSPLLLVVALAIKLDSPGPVLFRQPRIGRQNRQFMVLKFRSMRTDQSDFGGARSAGRSDDRVTLVGRFIRRTSIDELPQLLNVLIGEMSIVGPRPHAVNSTAEGNLFWDVDERYWWRHSCKPGITGLAQISGFRGATERHEDLINRVSSDLEYASRWSLLNDLKIIIKTCTVLIHPNAY